MEKRILTVHTSPLDTHREKFLPKPISLDGPVVRKFDFKSPGCQFESGLNPEKGQGKQRNFSNRKSVCICRQLESENTSGVQIYSWISQTFSSQCNHYLALVQNGKTRAKKSRAWRCVFDDTFSIVNVMRLTWNFLHVCPKCNWREIIKNRVSFQISCWLLRPPFKMWPSCDIQNPANCAPFCTP